MNKTKCQVVLLGPGPRSSGYDPIIPIFSGKNISYRQLLTAEDLDLVDYDLVFSIGYDRIIPEEVIARASRGVVVCHASDLPADKGWAPLYHTIVNQSREQVVTMFFASEQVDAGDIIAKAICRTHPLETINTLRCKSALMIKGLLERYAETLLRETVAGTPQCGAGNYNPKRTPADSRIDPAEPLQSLLPKIRALPADYPAYFEVAGERVCIQADIDEAAIFNEAEFTFKIKDYLTRKESPHVG